MYVLDGADQSTASETERSALRMAVTNEVSIVVDVISLSTWYAADGMLFWSLPSKCV